MQQSTAALAGVPTYECSAISSLNNWPVDAYDAEVDQGSYAPYPYMITIKFPIFDGIFAVLGVSVHRREYYAAIRRPYRNISPTPPEQKGVEVWKYTQGNWPRSTHFTANNPQDRPFINDRARMDYHTSCCLG